MTDAKILSNGGAYEFRQSLLAERPLRPRPIPGCGVPVASVVWDHVDRVQFSAPRLQRYPRLRLA